MLRVLLFLSVCLEAGGFAIGAAEDTPPPWLAHIPSPIPGSFPPPQPVSLLYTAGWAGMMTGRIQVEFSTQDGQQLLHLKGGTLGLARTLYRLDSDSSAICDRKTLAPINTIIQETYSDEARRTVQTFTPLTVSRTRISTPARKDDPKDRKTYLPHVFDLQSSMLYLRSQRLEPGDEVTFLSFATGSPYIARVQVLAKETVDVRAGRFPAIKLRLNLQSIDKNMVLKPYTRAKNVTAWVSDDPQRYFLKFTADLFIGTVFIELEKVNLPATKKG